MRLAVGTKLGPYEVIAAIGAGGMGEVYKARDTRLDRTVAVKVLPDHVAGDPDLKQRFEREAKTLATLSHPHICPVFDVGQQDGIDFLVMEYLEGETLAQRLVRTAGSKDPALPLPEALRYAIEIADALDKAHRHGIVHRDLKPGNIMLTKSGAKLLDFGLAKLGAGRSALGARGSEASVAPTISTPLTGAGSIIGTFQYMAPEQLEGSEADARTDIFAFGALVYEMLTGKKAFEGKTQASLIGSILKDEPRAASTIQPVIPPALDHVVGRCLEKAPEDRWQTALDLMRELNWIAEGGSQAGVAAPVVARRRGRDRLAWSAAGLMVGLIAAGVGAWSLMSDSPPLIRRFAIVLPENDQFTGLGRPIIALSPQGTHFVYVANEQLYLRALEQLDPIPLRGTDAGSRNPFFSPDGQWIGFWQGGQLKKVAISGGAPVKLCDAQNPWGASWAAGDVILYGQGPGGIWQVSGQGGTPERLVAVDEGKGETAHGPQLLPNRWVLFTLATGADWDHAQLVAQSLDTGERKVLVRGGRDARYVPTGHLVYLQEGTLLAVPFDLDRLEVTAGPVPLIEGVSDARGTSGAANFSTSGDGTLVYLPGGRGMFERTIVWVDRRGREEPLEIKPRPYSWVRMSPDGKRLAMEVQDRENTDVWIHDLARNTQTRLTFAPGADRYPLWTPDGRRIVWSAGSELVWKAADGTGQVERLTTSAIPLAPYAWSRDGKTLAANISSPTADILTLSMEGDHAVQPLIASDFTDTRATISPDGRWLAHQSNESGQFQIYVVPFPGVNDGRWQSSTSGGSSPVWSPVGRELFYRNGDAMMAVFITTEPSFVASTPEVLFRGAYVPDAGDPGRNYDISPDGRRFVMIKASGPTAAQASARIVLVQNWFEELKARVPGN